jgi:hypothetical protein
MSLDKQEICAIIGIVCCALFLIFIIYKFDVLEKEDHYNQQIVINWRSKGGDL